MLYPAVTLFIWQITGLLHLMHMHASGSHTAMLRWANLGVLYLSRPRKAEDALSYNKKIASEQLLCNGFECIGLDAAHLEAPPAAALGTLGL